MNELASSMESTYSTAKICKYGEDLSSCTPTLSLGGKIISITVRNKILALYNYKLIFRIYHTFKPLVNKPFIDISSMMAKNRSYDVLKHLWVEWRKASGNNYKKDYLDFIQMNNDGAQSLGNCCILKYLFTTIMKSMWLYVIFVV